jgi:hypothetical protein
LPPNAPTAWQLTQLPLVPFEWHAAQARMSRRAAAPWKSGEPRTSTPGPWKCWFAPTFAAPRSEMPRVVWHSSQNFMPWQRVHEPGSVRASHGWTET